MRIYVFKTKRIFLIFCLLMELPLLAQEKLNVLTSTTNLKSLTAVIGGDRINVDSIIKGVQDPHFIAPKPSYMLKARETDLLIFIGMDLEIAWLPSIIMGSRNPKIHESQQGHLNASQFIKALSVPKGKADRFFGDIHPYGNPHYLLDPLRAVQVSQGISETLAELDTKNKAYYLENQKQFKRLVLEKMTIWKQRVKASGIKKIVSYHGSFEYFRKAFDLAYVGMLEEKPGIAPSAKHLLKMVEKMKDSQSYCLLMSSFYNNERAKKIQKSIPVLIEVLDVEVTKKVTDYVLMIEAIVQAIERCGAFSKKQNQPKNQIQEKETK